MDPLPERGSLMNQISNHGENHLSLEMWSLTSCLNSTEKTEFLRLKILGQKHSLAKEIRGKIAKVVEEEWREELEKKNSLRIYRKFKKEMKEEDYSGSLESMVWLRAR